MAKGVIRYMSCCVCGGDAGRWHQHWNRDTGYGICAPCVTYCKSLGDTDAEIADLYGIEGENWGTGKLIELEVLTDG